VLVPARQTLAVALVVWIDGWQMQCCGAPFAVGSQVAWALGESDRDWLETVLSTDVQQTVDMAEDHHGALPADTRQTRASVTRIRAVHCRYASRPGHDPRTLYPVSGSGVLSDLKSADGWTRDCGDVQFAGYLVDLDSEETSPRRT
jgi:hypothetical protein